RRVPKPLRRSARTSKRSTTDAVCIRHLATAVPLTLNVGKALRHDYVTCPAKRIKTKTRNPKGVSSWFRVPSPPLFACNVVATRGARVDLPRPRDFLLRIDEHFLPLGDPSGRARNGEEHGEELDREAHRLVNQSRVEVDVRIELAGDEVLVLEGDALQ